MSAIRVFSLAVLAIWTATFGTVLDEAKIWWKFDQGGADGAVAATGEMHDCRDASVGAATQTCGPSGGPVWTNVAMRLPYRQKDVQCTALNVQVVPNAAGDQVRPTMVDVANGYVHSDTVTFFARFCAGEQLYTGTTDRFIYNNAFRWGSTKGDSYGQLFGIAVNGSRYSPEFFIGQESAVFTGLSVDPGKWYDMAISISMPTSTIQRVLCVLASEDGLFYHTVPRANGRSATGTPSGCRGLNSARFSFSASFSKTGARRFGIMAA